MSDGKGDLRRYPRSEVTAPVQLSWTGRDGNPQHVSARIIDLSETGMRVESRVQLDKGAYISFRADQLKLQGSASVRTSKKQGTKYLAGLEFAGGLKWKPQQKG